MSDESASCLCVSYLSVVQAPHRGGVGTAHHERQPVDLFQLKISRVEASLLRLPDRHIALLKWRLQRRVSVVQRVPHDHTPRGG